jgi:hypothetical protein
MCACSGATLKTRKRNISVPLDPGSFADAVITIINDAKTPDAPLDKNLAAAVKGLEGERRCEGHRCRTVDTPAPDNKHTVPRNRPLLYPEHGRRPLSFTICCRGGLGLLPLWRDPV